MVAYFQAQSAMLDEVVANIRTFFATPSEYSWIFNRDYSAMGTPYKSGEDGQPYYTVSGKFPDRFRFYPSVLVSTTVNQFIPLDWDNKMVQVNELNQYGKEDVKEFINGGDLVIGLSCTVRAMDQKTTEEISDILAMWSTTYGRLYFKNMHWFMNPFSYPGGIQVENLRDSTDQRRVYKSTLTTTMRGQWLISKAVSETTLEKLTIEQDFV